MHNQYSPYLLKASLPTAVAAALLSFAQMANSTVTDYSPDFSSPSMRMQRPIRHRLIEAGLVQPLRQTTVGSNSN